MKNIITKKFLFRVILFFSLHSHACAFASLFPERLHQMIQDERNHNIISWDKDGLSFRILSKEKLTKILNKYFRSKKYKTFERQLYNYNFYHDLENDTYSHPLFRRDISDLSQFKKSAMNNVAPSSKRGRKRKSDQNSDQETRSIQQIKDKEAKNSDFLQVPFNKKFQPISQQVLSFSEYSPCKIFVPEGEKELFFEDEQEDDDDKEIKNLVRTGEIDPLLYSSFF